jgi:divalent metal cation (Fe/Co/Zn/Cd) transporter
MGNSSSFGSLARKAILWVIAIAVAIFVLKAVVGLVMGVVSMLFGLVLLGLLAYAVIWAIRKL